MTVTRWGGDADQERIGVVEVAAATSIVLTNRAARQVETVRNISAFIVHLLGLDGSPVEPMPAP